MASTSQLNTLISLAEKKTDDAAKMLGAAIHAGREAEQKLALLHQYRDDYVARFETTRSAGLSAISHHNYRGFLNKLDNAIIGQQAIVEQTKRRIAENRSAWQENERKKMSFRTLSQRAQKEAQQLESKRDQKLMDEHAARRKNLQTAEEK